MMSDKKYDGKRFHPMKGLFFLLVAALFVVGVSLVIVFLWNNVLAEVVDVKQINIWQAMGLFVLAKILFGFRMGGQRHRKPPFMKSKMNWKNKWMNMTEEERIAFKAKWKEKCGR